MTNHSWCDMWPCDKFAPAHVTVRGSVSDDGRYRLCKSHFNLVKKWFLRTGQIPTVKQLIIQEMEELEFR